VSAWLAEQGTAESVAGFGRWTADISRATYDSAIATIRDLIREGETYQVNFTYRLHADAYGDPVRLYEKLRARQSVPYGALIHLPTAVESESEWVLSCSPELFVRSDGRHVLAQPMKGTAARAAGEKADADVAVALAHDEKNRAENVMIVDLLRNDLNRVCKPGSVRAGPLFEVHTWPTVHQMTSTIVGELNPGISWPDLIAATFPCGSITGAPKHRTMGIIADLEASPRGLYTGAIGWVDPPDQPDTALASCAPTCLSVAIRTVTLKGSAGGVFHSAMAGVGGGIIYDSRVADEFAETQVKTRYLRGIDPGFALFETLRVSVDNNTAQVLRVNEHYMRLAASADALGFPVVSRLEFLAIIEEARSAASAQITKLGREQRLRITLQCNGKLDFTLTALPAIAACIMVGVAEHHLTPLELALAHHKTTARATYDQAIAAASAVGEFDQLFFDRDDFLTEGARTSVLVLIDGQWLTPPLGPGVLPGVMRATLLADRQVVEAPIHRSVLLAAPSLRLANSLRGVMEAKLSATARAMLGRG
jgi:para-aminobenzoate synthetase / 4-amino-4-deoxychorismate lyase